MWWEVVLAMKGGKVLMYNLEIKYSLKLEGRPLRK
jgi:hypothetical protein